MQIELYLLRFFRYLNPIFWFTHYLYESLFLMVLALYLTNYIFGSRKNQRLANRHLTELAKYYDKHFKNIGKHRGTPHYALYESENGHLYKMYASQNAIMPFCLVSLYLKHRENLMNYYGYDFIFPTKERLIIEIGVQMQFRSLICFGIVKTNQIKRIKQEGYEDLKTICKVVPTPHLDAELQVLSEYEDVAESICSPQVIELLNENKKWIHIIYISDVDRDPASKVTVKIMTNLQANPDYGKLVELSVQLARQVNQVKLVSRKMNKAIQVRRKFNSKFKD